MAADSELDEFDDLATNTLFDLVFTKAEENLNAKRAKKQALITDVEISVKLFDKLFNYIYAAQCQRLFSLARYNNLTYALNADDLSKTLLELCYNGPNYNLKKLDFLEILSFIDITPAKFNEVAHK